MLDLALRDQVLHGTGNILNRYRRIDAVLIEEFNSINPQPLQRLLGYLPDALGSAIGRSRSAGSRLARRSQFRLSALERVRESPERSVDRE